MAYGLWQYGLTGDVRLTRQTGEALGQRLKTAWEWAAVIGQVEVYGWQKLDVRCCHKLAIHCILCSVPVICVRVCKQPLQPMQPMQHTQKQQNQHMQQKL